MLSVDSVEEKTVFILVVPKQRGLRNVERSGGEQGRILVQLTWSDGRRGLQILCGADSNFCRRVYISGNVQIWQ